MGGTAVFVGGAHGYLARHVSIRPELSLRMAFDYGDTNIGAFTCAFVYHLEDHVQEGKLCGGRHMNVKETLEALAEGLQTTGVRTIFGEPISVEGRTVIPVARVAYGYGSGGGVRERLPNTRQTGKARVGVAAEAYEPSRRPSSKSHRTTRGCGRLAPARGRRSRGLRSRDRGVQVAGGQTPCG